MRFPLILTLMLVVGSAALLADPPSAEPSETELIERIKTLSSKLAAPDDILKDENHQSHAESLLAAADQFIARFPTSSFRFDAQIAKLEATAKLAYSDPTYLHTLLDLTNSIAASNPTETLASENAFFAIQAFIMGARLEAMPEERRLQGAIERYKAFLEDYPNSRRGPVIWASLIRNLIAMKQTDSAERELEALRAAFPTHSATRRAAGEVFRATCVGKPYSAVFTLFGGTTIRMADMVGNVVIVHFWATWNKPSLKEIVTIKALHGTYADRGLRCIGVNLDRTTPMFEAAKLRLGMAWPQYHDGKGLESDAVIDNGIISLPVSFVVDREGIIRHVDTGERLKEVVEELLKTPDHPAGSESQAP